MTAAENYDQSDDSFSGDSASPEHLPVDERLETALGGDLTRFLLSGLAQGPSRDEPR